MKATALFLASFFALSAQASILTTQPNPAGKKLDKVVLASSASVALNGQNIELAVVGSGIRIKDSFLGKVKVYVAQLFSSDAGSFIRTEAEALDSLKNSRTTVISLSFVRTVDAPTVQTSFDDALKANSIDKADPAISAFLTAVRAGGEAKDNRTVVIAIQKNADGSETLTYENNEGALATVQGQDLTKKVMSIWLGVPADNGVASLKKQLLQAK